MAFSHRNLLPTQPEVNETKECSGFCDSSSTEISYCPQNCLLICSSICNTTNAFTHSPPSPLPVPSPGGRTNQTPHILPLVILIVVVFGGSFLIYIFYTDIVKWYSNWKSSWRPPPLSENTHDDILEDNHGPVINHPIRFNTTGGLQESTIKSITACKYKRGAGLVEGTECSVCLNELEDDETLRLLPKCNHTFHLSCIDTWLRTHTTCPLCRSSVVSNTAGPPVTEMEPNSNNSATGNETLVENSGSDAQS